MPTNFYFKTKSALARPRKTSSRRQQLQIHIFPKKSFNVANRLKKKTQILHFFTSTRIFKDYPNKKVEFICKEKGCQLHEPFGDLSNLNKHFTNRPNDHPIMKKWYELYTKKNSSSQQKVIPDSTFSLIKFFIASDTALEQFKS